MTITNKKLIEILTVAIENVETANALIAGVINQLNEKEKREWVGLTDEERMQLAVTTGAMSADWLPFMEAVETKIKEKNGIN